MRHLALFALVVLAADADGRDRRCRASRDSRMQDSCGGYAFFEAYNRIGTDWCSTAAGAANGTRGETLTHTRATVATCTKGVNGLRSTLIADGDLTSLGVNVPRLEADADGYLGLLVEGAMAPVTIQARALCNAAWADVGTPGCAADSTTGPWGTTTMALLTDDDGAVHEGRSQTMATTSLTRHTFSCYLKAGTSTTAELSFTGTGNAAGDFGVSVTGLSTTTSTRIVVTSPVAYAAGLTAVTAKVLVGTNAAGTGTIYAEGCNHVPNATYGSSFMDAAAVAVARGAETSTFNGSSWPAAPTYCIGATITPEWAMTTGGIVEGQVGAASGIGFFFASGFLRAQNLTSGADNVFDFATTPTALVTARFSTRNDGTNQSHYKNGALIAGPTAKTPGDTPWSTATGVGYSPGGLGQLNGIITRVQVDSNPLRCDQ